MRYLGGKAKIAKRLTGYINEQLEPGQPFVDLFCGAGNIISQIDPNRERIANDANLAVVSVLRATVDGFEFPDLVTEEDYKQARSLPKDNPLHGFILIGCSFAGGYKGGFARSNRGRNYADTTRRGLLKKKPGLTGVYFLSQDYSQVAIPEDALVYCDIPYHGTTKYKGVTFCHDEFYHWVERQPNTILISEYGGSYNPLNLPIVWELESRKSLRDKNGECVTTKEILYRYN